MATRKTNCRIGAPLDPQKCGWLTGPLKSEKPNFALADTDSAFLGNWFPRGDAARMAYEHEREPMTKRSLDLYRNYGTASGVVDLIIQHLTATFSPTPTPDEKVLIDWTPDELAEWVSNRLCWHAEFLEGTELIDAGENSNFTGMMETGMRGHEYAGEITGSMEYLDPRRGTNSHRPFGSAAFLFTPGRIYTPWDVEMEQLDQDMRGGPRNRYTTRVTDGIRRNGYGRMVGAFVNDYTPEEACQVVTGNLNEKRWKFVRQYGVNGMEHRRLLFHCFERRELEQVRGYSIYSNTGETHHNERQLIRLILARAQRQNQITGVFKSQRKQDTRRVAQQLGLIPGGGHQPGGAPQGDPALPGEWQLFGKSNHMTPEQIAAIGDCSAEFRHVMMRNWHHKQQATSEALAGINELHLYDDEDFEQIQADNSTLDATAVLQMLAGSQSAGHSIPQNMLRRNYDVGNYTGMRAGRLDFDAMLVPKKNNADKLANWLQNAPAEECIENGLLKLPESVERRWRIETPQDRRAYFITFRRALMSTIWNKPQQRLIDPMKDAMGQGELEDRKYKAWSEIVGAMNGRDRASQIALIEQDQRALIDLKIRVEQYEAQARKAAESVGAPTPNQLDDAGGDR
jgi:capsid protein